MIQRASVHLHHILDLGPKSNEPTTNKHTPDFLISHFLTDKAHKTKMKLFLCVLTFLQVCFIPSLAEGVNATSEESLYEEAIPLLSGKLKIKGVPPFAARKKSSESTNSSMFVSNSSQHPSSCTLSPLF